MQRQQLDATRNRKSETSLISILSRPVQILRRSIKSKSKAVKEARRKREVDHCVKKTGDVVARFDKSWLSVTANRNKKQEQEFKKDIKKLQVLKKKIKDGIANGIGKDPRLLDAKRQVESCLGRVKVIEKQWYPIEEEIAKCDLSATLQSNQLLPVQESHRKDMIKLYDEASVRPIFQSQNEKQKQDGLKSVVAIETTKKCRKTDGVPETNSQSDLERVQLWLSTALAEFQNLNRKYEEEIKSIPINGDEKLILKLNGRTSMHVFQMRKLEKLSDSVKNLPRDVKNLQNFFSLIQQTKRDIGKYLKKSNEEFATFMNDVRNARLENSSVDNKNDSPGPMIRTSNTNPKVCEDEVHFSDLILTFTCSGVSVSTCKGSEFPSSVPLNVPEENILDAPLQSNIQTEMTEVETISKNNSILKIPKRRASRRTRIINRLSANPHDAQFLLSRRQMIERRECRRQGMKLKLRQPPGNHLDPQNNDASGTWNLDYLPMVAMPDRLVP